MEAKAKGSTGRRAWLWTSVVISVLVLILSVGLIIGVWVVRGIAIDLNNSLMDGVTLIAENSSQSVVRVQVRVNEVSTTVSEVESTADNVAQNVSERGVLLTLLPPEREQVLINNANQIRETVSTITASMEAAVDLYRSVNAIPFVDLPRPSDERLQEIEAGAEQFQSNVEDLRDEVQEFRDNTAAEVSRVATAAGNVKSRLQETEARLDQFNADLEALQASAQSFKSTFALWGTIITIVLTLIFLWVIYAMVVLIQKSIQELNS